jgi:hypothetical protein
MPSIGRTPLWRETYAGFNGRHFSERLVELDHLKVSRGTARCPPAERTCRTGFSLTYDRASRFLLTPPGAAAESTPAIAARRLVSLARRHHNAR